MRYATIIKSYKELSEVDGDPIESTEEYLLREGVGLVRHRYVYIYRGETNIRAEEVIHTLNGERIELPD